MYAIYGKYYVVFRKKTSIYQIRPIIDTQFYMRSEG